MDGEGKSQVQDEGMFLAIRWAKSSQVNFYVIHA